ncbi:MAG: hypothetical protein LAT82_01410 [Nanoarchaeota archaeon]|nr:hypothetical protein [Nanoarchaeota archaeon]
MIQRFLGQNGSFLVSNSQVLVKDEKIPQGFSTNDLVQRYNALTPFLNGNDEDTFLHLYSDGRIIKKTTNTDYITTRLELSIVPTYSNNDKNVVFRGRGELVYSPPKSNTPTQIYDLEYEIEPSKERLTISKIKDSNSSTISRFEDFKGYFKRRGFTIETLLDDVSKYRRILNPYNAQIEHLKTRISKGYEHLKDSDLVREEIIGLNLDEVIELKKEGGGGDAYALNYLKSLHRRYPLHFGRFK